VRQENGFSVLEASDLDETLGGELVEVADAVRDLATELGVRPYVCRMVWVSWTGGERGVGVDAVAREVSVLPTPLVSDPAVALRHHPFAVVEEGTLRVTEVSARYTEDQLRGLGPDGAEVPEDQEFFWEVYLLQRDGTSIRRRYTVAGVPTLAADRAEWVVMLRRAAGDRDRYGSLP
jgi:hypothetical protein